MIVVRPLALFRRDDRHRRERERERKRHRARLNRDSAVAPVEFSHEVVNFLVDLGWLDRGQSEDRREVGISISRMITDAARAHHNR